VGLISAPLDLLQPRRWLEAFLDVLFPPQCAGCGSLGAVWCQTCQSQVQRLAPPFCARCGLPLRSGSYVCRPCADRPAGLIARSYAWYQPPFESAVLRLKYRRDLRLADVLAGWLEDVYRREAWRADVVTAVPLSPARLAQRGYNQASLLGQALGKRVDIPFEDRLLRRTRETGSQVGLNADERKRNVAGAFAADSARGAGRVVLLVDDLFTTGSTLEACAQALTKVGAETVYGLTLGRAGHKSTLAE
jgi:ComF family protein